MTCPDCGDRLQQWLDSRTRDAASVPGEPPALCPACAEWSAAARRFDRGLRLLAPPVPPQGLGDRIVARIAAERQFRRVRLLFAAAAAAMAAAVLVVAWKAFPTAAPAPAPPPPPVALGPGPAPAPAETTLRDSMAEAGSAVAALTTRTAGETVEETRKLLPAVEPPPLGTIDMPPLDPPAHSLAETGEGVTAGLEPVADSARRAVGLFLRELPVDATRKSGL